MKATKNERFCKVIIACAVLLSHQASCQYYTELPLTRCTMQYYQGTKSVSTSVCYDSIRRNGRAVVLNKSGDTTAQWHLRGYAGSASVHFDYHANGAPRKAHYSSQPDGGIQFYRETVTFDQQGNVLDRWEEEYPHKLTVVPSEYIAKPPISYSTFWIRNNRTKAMHLYLTDKEDKAEKWTLLSVDPGKSVRLHSTYIQDTSIRSLQRFEAYLSKKPGSLQGLKRLNLSTLPVHVVDEGVQRIFTLQLK